MDILHSVYHSSVGGHLGCFLRLAIANSASNEHSCTSFAGIPAPSYTTYYAVSYDLAVNCL